MRIIVLGAGVIGVTTAYMLAVRGHDVVVLDRNANSGMETSFANGAQLSYSYAEPWATPGVLPKILPWLLREDSPLVMRLNAIFDPHMIGWSLRFLRNCTNGRVQTNSVNILRLGLYSRKIMEQIRAYTGITFENARDGILHIFTEQKEFDGAIRQAMFQEKFGCKENILDVDHCLRLEPSLAQAGKRIIGGIHAPLDESGDAYEFTQKLADICARDYNVEFKYNTPIERLEHNGDTLTGVRTQTERLTADAYVMALGSYSPVYLRPLGVNIPVYPMKGYSITLPASIHTPKMSVSDMERKIVYSPLGSKLRIAGTAEFGGYNTDIDEKRIKPMVRAVEEVFPQAATQPIERWACLRASTPDGPPIIGKCKYKNLYLNTGHGTLGWTQAAGSANILADIIDDNTPEISLNGMTIDRFL